MLSAAAPWHNSPSLSLFGAFGSGICPPSARYPLHGVQEFRVEQAGTIPSRCSPDAWMDAPRKPAATVKQGRRAYWKLSVYLAVIHESDPSGKLTHWKNAGYVHEPEVTTEIIRPRGAVFHDSDATPIGKSKGGKDAIYISEKVLKAIHIAKSLGKL